MPPRTLARRPRTTSPIRNPRAATKLVPGAPRSASQPLDWTRKHGVQVKDPRWANQARDIEEVLTATGLRLGRKLGCGTFGCAYLDAKNHNRVIKITGDPTEVAAAARVIEARAKGAKLPGVVKFYAVYALRNKSLFIVVQERLVPLRPREFEFVQEHQDDIYNIGTGRSTTSRPYFVSKSAARYGVPATQIRALLDVFKQLAAVGVEYHDLHEGNVLRTKTGRLKVIDLGISKSGGAKVRIIPK